MQQWGASVEVLDLSSNQLSGSLPNLTWQNLKLKLLSIILPEGMVASSSSIPNLLDDHPTTSGKEASPGSPLSSSPQFVEPTKLDVYSPDSF
ncbi:hypothetical protein SADUNF_Sadunf07G0075100 [Salix dunnii]|uniref:Uncharacterized protein n=1 Tax=Salix dunnii TaxID=1413687 RepID=A0A835K027_9ROSI|nr:hypothetical protein SADUNF_Sadunf07G0075100 [Salix dunnii]